MKFDKKKVNPTLVRRIDSRKVEQIQGNEKSKHRDYHLKLEFKYEYNKQSLTELQIWCGL